MTRKRVGPLPRSTTRRAASFILAAVWCLIAPSFAQAEGTMRSEVGKPLLSAKLVAEQLLESQLALRNARLESGLSDAQGRKSLVGWSFGSEHPGGIATVEMGIKKAARIFAGCAFSACLQENQ